MKTKKDKIVDAAKEHVGFRIKLVHCQQKHFKQLCSRCPDYTGCNLYLQYCKSWMKMERAVVR